ncbi:F-box only protein 9 [Entomophthora muscae]|uniref:F-box only protein 9 n=1 Tax=Entomophthora muscae TaxID=34485 RepID=A0ACC2SNV1_9FUNG|nr:F-box only protein 9 [Entomophthora muscae]
MRRKTTITGLVVLFIVVISYTILLNFNIKEAKQRTISSKYTSQNATIQIDESNPDAGSEAKMEVEIRILRADLINSIVTTQIAFFPSAQLATDHKRLKTPLLAYFAYYQKAYQVNHTMPSVEATFPILSGSTSYYPFDSFLTEIAVEITDLQTGIRIPTVVKLKASVAALKLDIIRTQQLKDGTESDLVSQVSKKAGIDGEIDNFQEDVVESYKFTLRITRPPTIIFFSIFVIILMWVISLVMAGVAFTIILLVDTRPEGGYMALGSGLLFALPFLRNAQPDVPPIGIIIDAMGFIWNMIIVTSASILIAIIWIKRREVQVTFA